MLLNYKYRQNAQTKPHDTAKMLQNKAYIMQRQVTDCND